MCSIERRVFSLACSLQLNWQFSLFSVFWASCRSSFFSPLLFYDRFSTEAHTRNFRPAFTSNGYENVVYRKAPKQGLFFGKFFSLHDVMKKSIDRFCRIFCKMLFVMFIKLKQLSFCFSKTKDKRTGQKFFYNKKVIRIKSILFITV